MGTGGAAYSWYSMGRCNMAASGPEIKALGLRPGMYDTRGLAAKGGQAMAPEIGFGSEAREMHKRAPLSKLTPGPANYFQVAPCSPLSIAAGTVC
jgi:hypothetical protein